jgi:hypothetical protein
MNEINPNMNLPKQSLGVVYPPDDKVSSDLYNHKVAGEKFKQLNNDIYQSEKAVKSDKKSSWKGIATSILLVSGICLMTKFKPISKLVKLIKGKK